LPAPTAPRRFPVLRGQSNVATEIWQAWPRSVPWAWVERFRARAQGNHDQTLERLAKRGGLCPTELWIAAHDLRLFQKVIAVPSELECGEWLIAEMRRLGEVVG